MSSDIREPPFDSGTDQTASFAKSPGPTVQSILRADKRSPRPAFLQTSYQFLGNEDIPVERYISDDWRKLEIARVWRKTWQVACRSEDIPTPGDYLVYDIADDSVLVVRTASGQIKAYINACLHRGTALCDDTGNKKALRCPFHGYTWSLEGSLLSVPGKWDFPHVRKENFQLPEVKLGEWGGFVFVNLDPHAGELTDYLEILPQHLDGEELASRYKALHVSQVVPCNWKVVQEAFIEGYHVAETHYEKDRNGNIVAESIAGFSHDTGIQYDIWPTSRHINRLILAGGVPSQYVADRIAGEQGVIDALLRDLSPADRPQVRIGQTAREVLADFNRLMLTQLMGTDLSQLSDSDAIDQTQYNIFPNFTIWPGVFAPLSYRFRPYGVTADQALFEVWFLHPRPTGKKVQVARERRLGPKELWSSIPELGPYGPIIDQDIPNLARIQRGLKATRKPGVTLGNYQEIRIRHFHKTLSEYMSVP